MIDLIRSMKKYWLGTQLFIKKQDLASTSFQHIEMKISQAKQHAGLDSLIYYSDDPSIHQEIYKICERHQLESYLWFPVMADAPGIDPQNDDLQTNFLNKQGNGSIACWEQLGQGNEEFLFMCPNNQKTVEKIFLQFQKLIQLQEWQGVMLDRIRYPSCANGFESLFSCFCEHCHQTYFEQTGQSLNDIKKRARQFVERISDDHLLEKNPQGWEVLWEASELNALGQFREKSILTLAQRFCDYAHQQGLKVGLDLYSPALASLVGQNYEKLSQSCDWIKPMIYCQVNGPAGLPLEYRCLWEALKTINSSFEDEQIKTFLEKSLNAHFPKSPQALLKEGFQAEVIGSELAAIQGLNLSKSVEVFPGIEAVRIPDLEIDIDQQKLMEYLTQIEGKSNGLIASWNILDIPDENFKTIGKVIKGKKRTHE